MPTMAEARQRVAQAQADILNKRDSHEAAQAAFSATVKVAARTREDACKPHYETYLAAEAVAKVNTEVPSQEYLDAIVELDTAIAERNELIRITRENDAA